MKINYYYLNVKKKINNFQIIIINNLAFFSVYNKGYFSGQKDHSKNIFHCMKPSNTWMEYSFRNANKLLLLLKINKINKIIKIAMSASIYINDKKKTKIIGIFNNWICNTGKYYSMHSKFNTRNTNSERYPMQSPSQLQIVKDVAFLATPGDSGIHVIYNPNGWLGIQYSQYYSTNAIVFERDTN